MSNWVAKRFWTDVNVVEQEGGFAVQLDTRPVKTPAKAPLVVPSREMGEAVAEEWRAVVEKIDPSVMSFTRSANAAIDKVSVQFNEVAEMLAAYGGSDLLCYRADSPQKLVARQANGWDPLIDWADKIFGGRLVPTQGIMPITQNETALEALTTPLFSASPFELAALHDLIAMSGSLVIALAVTQRRLTASDAWDLSRIDEKWQEEQWGVDDDATQVAEIKRTAFFHAADFYQMANIDARR
ncbi:Chaperone required for the assembly of the F1-ATPase [Octadecabacter temperatus]|uniref:ATP12 chaperone protein n=1 Tax=Octadecabacter temperatus TaxID=1458307 RepID=A0A0K0Y1R9_9RHOB|nr:ATP12 family protein [Octadecabacter temperatus]AKS44879.1 ATP12 chaperone protein [Octadecabacter temperatus]SIO34154.1 Chaperone required for the assembly of the F1-ATPase [Octadecabacter temperatus]